MSDDNRTIGIENLVEMLQDDGPLVRIHAGFRLGMLEDEALPAVPTLVEMLKFGDIRDRKLAATTLAQIGPAASDAIPALLDAANDDEDEDVSMLAMWALEEIDLADTDEEAEGQAA